MQVQPELDFFDAFQDPYLKQDEGRGVFLAGVLLGMVAYGQAGGGAIDSAPLYKQLNFGRVQRRDLLKHMSRIPELTRVYQLKGAGRLEALCGKAGEMLLSGNGAELGVEGNFAFSVAFLNARDYYFKKIFGAKDVGEVKENMANELSEEGLN